jgi:hypothetical protein
MATTNDDDETRLNSASLKDVSVMNDDGETLGLPSSLFFLGVATTLVFTFMLRWYIGAAFGLVYFLAMYTIHDEDPKALQSWADALLGRRHVVWSGGKFKNRRIFIIDKKD